MHQVQKYVRECYVHYIPICDLHAGLTATEGDRGTSRTSSDICEKLKIKQLLLHIQRSPLRLLPPALTRARPIP